jgi:hypothetical protein
MADSLSQIVLLMILLSVASSARLYSQDVKLRVLVCYVSSFCIPKLSKLKNNHSRDMYMGISNRKIIMDVVGNYLFLFFSD